MLDPIGHRVLVLMDEVKETYHETKHILVPEKELDREQAGMEKGTLIKMGPYAYNSMYDGPVNLQEGDKVLVKKYEGTKIVHEGKLYRFCNDVDIHGRIIDE